jgi:hypothetical protein
MYNTKTIGMVPRAATIEASEEEIERHVTGKEDVNAPANATHGG